jgi:clan AA aspartic protease (TIGR02281 family)
MKTRVVTIAVFAAGLLFGGSAAHAGITCNLTDSRSNTLSYTFARGGEGFTNEISVRRNGAVISNGGPQWSRGYDRGRKLMVLEQGGWFLAYEAKATEAETSQAMLFHGNNRIATGSCYADHSMDAAPAPQPAPEYIATEPAAPPVMAQGDSVPFFMIHGAMHVQVNIGGILSDMMLDTGANVSSVTPAIADRLIAAGKATEMESVTVNLADGSNRTERMVKISSLTIGSHTRTEVAVTVSDGEMLLGLPVLNAIGRFTIDAGASQLIFG